MSVAVAMYLDPEAEARIKGIWRELAEKHVSSHMLDSGWRPHISLAVFDHLDIEDARNRLASFAAGIPPFPITLSSVGRFSGENDVLFLSPLMSEELLRVHRDFHRLFECHRDAEWEYYLEHRWVPHCTLAERLPNDSIPKAVEIGRGISLPIEARIIEMAIVEFRPVRELSSFRLGDDGSR